MSYPIEDYTPPSANSKHDLKNTFSWDGMIGQTEFFAAPVASFRHVSYNIELFQVINSFFSTLLSGSNVGLLGEHHSRHESRG